MRYVDSFIFLGSMYILYVALKDIGQEDLTYVETVIRFGIALLSWEL